LKETAKMSVPQKLNVVVEWASCPLQAQNS